MSKKATPYLLIEDLQGVVHDAEVLKRARAIASDADEYVRANPWLAIGAVAGIALLLGLLVSRR